MKRKNIIAYDKDIGFYPNKNGVKVGIKKALAKIAKDRFNNAMEKAMKMEYSENLTEPE